MGKTIAAVTGGVVLGLAIAFANAGAFQFPWGSSDDASKPQVSSRNQAKASHQPAPPNAPEPNEPAVALPSWAPLVKQVMPTVVNVAVVQEVKSSGFPFPGGDSGSGDEGQGPGMGPQGPGPGGNPFGPGNPFGGGDPFEQF